MLNVIVIVVCYSQLVTYGVRDFVESWYYGHISNDPHFIELVRECASSVLINFASR